jgi:dUTP pyrophosphatase
MQITIRVINNSDYPLPSYQTEGASGMDIRANITDAIHLKPMERVLVPTGLFIELPQGYEAQVRPRSGIALKQGITCLNSPGTIDADYRGEIKVILVNLSGEMQSIESGDRIAQMVVQKIEKIEWLNVTTLASSDRSNGGFGSTGK